MTFLALLRIIKPSKKKIGRALQDYKQEILVKQGREQFKRLMDKGLSVPVALL